MDPRGVPNPDAPPPPGQTSHDQNRGPAPGAHMYSIPIPPVPHKVWYIEQISLAAIRASNSKYLYALVDIDRCGATCSIVDMSMEWYQIAPTIFSHKIPFLIQPEHIGSFMPACPSVEELVDLVGHVGAFYDLAHNLDISQKQMVAYEGRPPEISHGHDLIARLLIHRSGVRLQQPSRIDRLLMGQNAAHLTSAHKAFGLVVDLNSETLALSWTSPTPELSQQINNGYGLHPFGSRVVAAQLTRDRFPPPGPPTRPFFNAGEVMTTIYETIVRIIKFNEVRTTLDSFSPTVNIYFVGEPLRNIGKSLQSGIDGYPIRTTNGFNVVPTAFLKTERSADAKTAYVMGINGARMLADQTGANYVSPTRTPDCKDEMLVTRSFMWDQVRRIRSRLQAQHGPNLSRDVSGLSTIGASELPAVGFLVDCILGSLAHVLATYYDAKVIPSKIGRFPLRYDCFNIKFCAGGPRNGFLYRLHTTETLSGQSLALAPVVSPLPIVNIGLGFSLRPGAYRTLLELSTRTFYNFKSFCGTLNRDGQATDVLVDTSFTMILEPVFRHLCNLAPIDLWAHRANHKLLDSAAFTALLLPLAPERANLSVELKGAVEKYLWALSHEHRLRFAIILCELWGGPDTMIERERVAAFRLLGLERACQRRDRFIKFVHRDPAHDRLCPTACVEWWLFLNSEQVHSYQNDTNVLMRDYHSGCVSDLAVFQMHRSRPLLPSRHPAPVDYSDAFLMDGVDMRWPVNVGHFGACVRVGRALRYILQNE